jgi:hypothetical protein
VTQDFRSSVFFHQSTPCTIGPWLTGYKTVRIYGIVFAEKVAPKFVKIENEVWISQTFFAGSKDEIVFLDILFLKSCETVMMIGNFAWIFKLFLRGQWNFVIFLILVVSVGSMIGWSRKWIFLLTRKSTFFRKYFYLRVITRNYA